MNSLSFSSGHDHLRPTLLLFGLMLVGSLCTEVKIPGVGIGLQNLAIPAAGTGILLIRRCAWRPVWDRQRRFLLALLALSTWALVASLLSPLPTTSLYYWIKYHLLAVGLAAALVIVADHKLALASLKVTLAFVSVLAVIGVAEAVFPDSVVFLLFRSDASRSIFPRVASLMPWPNQYGVLMAAGVAVTQVFAVRGMMASRWAVPMTLLLLTQVAQSGSRNAWMALLGGVVWMAARRQITPIRAGALVGVFLTIVLALPVSARQTGLWDNPSDIPGRFIIDDTQLHSRSLSPPGLSLDLRTRLWREAIVEIRKRPVSGLGLEAYQREIGPRVMGRQGFNAHNLALNIAVEIGLVGLLLALVAGWQLLRARRPGGLVFEAAFFIALSSQILDCYLYDATFMVIFFLLAVGLTTPAEDA